MEFSEDRRAGIGVALNEAKLLGIEVDPHRRRAVVTFAVLRLPAEGLPPPDPRVQFVLDPVGRVAASLRQRQSGDQVAQAEPLQLRQLLEVVQSFHGLPVYGWEFLDIGEERFAAWSDGLSLDFRSGDDGLTHTLTLFQDSGARILNIRIWFDTLTIYGPSRAEIFLDEFIAGGRRWWAGLSRGDPRTAGTGIFPDRRPHPGE